MEVDRNIIRNATTRAAAAQRAADILKDVAPHGTPLTDEEWSANADRQIEAFLWEGVGYGWWQDIDWDAREPVQVIRMSDFRDTALMAHVWCAAIQKFESVKAAKRAGWNKPIAPGTYRIGTYIIRVVDDKTDDWPGPWMTVKPPPTPPAATPL